MLVSVVRSKQLQMALVRQKSNSLERYQRTHRTEEAKETGLENAQRRREVEQPEPQLRFS